MEKAKLRRIPEQSTINFEQNPDLVAYAGRATILEMIGHLPARPGDLRRPWQMQRAHELRFVRSWYRHGYGGLLLQSSAVDLVRDFGIAPNEQAAEMLLINTIIQPGGDMSEDKRREFAGGRARWTSFVDLINPPTGYHLHPQGYQETDAYIMRPLYSAA